MAIINSKRWRAGAIPPVLRPWKWTILFLGSLVLGFSIPVQAHDPGLSFAEIELESRTIRVTTSFARRDIETLVTLDDNRDGHISEPELSKGELPLKRLARHSVELIVDNLTRVGTPSEIVLNSSDALVFTYRFMRGKDDTFTFKAPIIDRLAPGHRQFLSVVRRGKPIRSEILSAVSDETTIRLQTRQSWRQVARFAVEGIGHIAIGYDHILFLIAMLLPAALNYAGGVWRAKTGLGWTVLEVVKIVTAFTAAHSITLALAVFGLIRLNSTVVETTIAASVAFAAVNNLRPLVKARPWLVSFGFGLIHGLGFAGALTDLGISYTAKVYALLGFNLGVEIGQLALIAVLFPAIFLGSRSPVYRCRIMPSASVVIALIASFWITERIGVGEGFLTLLSLL